MTFNLDQLLILLVIASAVSVFATTLTNAELFEPLRVRISETSWIPEWVSTLLDCTYCVIHWVSIAAVVIYQPLPVEGVPVLDFLVALGAMIMAASICSGLLYKLYD